MHYLSKSLNIYVYTMPVLDSKMYIIKTPNQKQSALIIDPVICDEALPILHTISHAKVLLTHSHYDHISGVNWLKEQIDCTLSCTELCACKLTNPHENLAAFASALVIGKSDAEQKQFMKLVDLNFTCQADEIFSPELHFEMGDYQVETIQTPGHSACSQCLRFSTSKKELPPEILFTGDSLVNGHEIITRLPGGNKKDYLAKTKPFLDSVANDVLIMPGHGDWGLKREM